MKIPVAVLVSAAHSSYTMVLAATIIHVGVRHAVVASHKSLALTLEETHEIITI